MISFSLETSSQTTSPVSLEEDTNPTSAVPPADPGRHRLRNLHVDTEGNVSSWNERPSVSRYEPEEIIGHQVSIPTRTGRKTCRDGLLRSPPAKGASKRRVGDFVRMVRASGRTSSSTPSRKRAAEGQNVVDRSITRSLAQSGALL